VADPILWLFWKNKLIPSIKDVSLKKTVKISLELIAMIIIILTASSNVFHWKYMNAPIIYIIAACFIGGSTCLLNNSQGFSFKNAILFCLGIIVFSLFIPIKLIPVINIVGVSWCVAIICHKILDLIQIDQLSFIPANQSGKLIIMSLYLLIPMVIGIIFFNLI